MFRRNRTDAIREGAASASELALQLARDRRFRRKLLSALEHGSAATSRALPRRGLAATLVRVASDQALLKELRRAGADLADARERAEKRASRRGRKKWILVTAVVGAGALPPVRRRLRAAVAAVSGRARPGRSGVPLEELSKDELYARAQAANIPGRSDMSKEQLIEALRVQG